MEYFCVEIAFNFLRQWSGIVKLWMGNLLECDRHKRAASVWYMWNACFPILLVTVLTGDQFKKFNTTLLLTRFLFKRGLKKIMRHFLSDLEKLWQPTLLTSLPPSKKYGLQYFYTVAPDSWFLVWFSHKRNWIT